jgi:hypothetical protein
MNAQPTLTSKSNIMAGEWPDHARPHGAAIHVFAALLASMN